ncbi:MAG: ribonuclease III [Acidimicrobiia bacterium]|nr:ribonuclease III [Acidimicrobiia bacterium]
MAAVEGDNLAERIGYRFADETLKELALRHRSWVAEQRPVAGARPASNERLELLGDAVLDVVVSEHLYTSYPDLDVGQLAKVRASVVSADCLAELAGELRLGQELLVGRGEEAAGGRAKRSILADATEALIGAVYLDGGWEPARRLVLSLLTERIAAVATDPGRDDYKTVLQERAAHAGDAAPSYRLSHSGPDHELTWRAVLMIGDSECGAGEGRTKKQAEQAAAHAALARYESESPADRLSPECPGAGEMMSGGPCGSGDDAARTP